MHESTFEYLKPTDDQLMAMNNIRQEFAIFSKILEDNLPEGADKIYIMRKLRETAMWSNISITRQADGTPR